MTKVDDLQPHPVKEQLPGVHFCLNSSPPWPEAILLGFQHFIVMLGTSVFIPTLLVPLMGGGNVEKAQVIETLLFVAGINTLLQTWFGTRLPVVMGGSYAFIIPIISIALSNNRLYVALPFGDNSHQIFKQSMRDVQGALIIASFFQIILGFFGFIRIFARFLSPLAAVPLVTLTGLSLIAISFPQLARCIEVGLPTLIILILLSQYLPYVLKSKRRVFDRFAVLFSVAIVWGYAEILTAAGAYDKTSPNTQFSCRTDRSGLISAAPWLRFPYPFQWGRPSFNIGDAFAMIAASLVALIESIGTFIAASRYSSATIPPPSVLSRGVGWQGIGTLLSGLYGTGSGTAASVENAGLLGLTGIGSRRVTQISAAFMIFFSVLGKFGAVLASIPLPIFAALYCVLFAYVVAAGLNFLQFCNLNSFRTMFIVGFSIFIGLSVAEYFNQYLIISGHGPVHTGSISFNNVVQVIFMSAATVALVFAFLVDCTHGCGDGSTRLDSGRHWWGRFRYFSTDTRSEEFYSLPYNLNRFSHHSEVFDDSLIFIIINEELKRDTKIQTNSIITHYKLC